MLPQVPNALGEGPITLGEPSQSATLEEEFPAMPLTVKRPSLSAENHTLREAFPECRPALREDLMPSVSSVHQVINFVASE
jgi:hypothetical protein